MSRGPARRLYANTAAGQVHGRLLGHGAPLVLLHPSPLSSAFMAPQQEALAARWRTLALDTPGYGQSDPLPAPAESLDPYAQVLLAALDNLGIERFALCGSATGAQIALVIARQAPERVTRLVLDNCGHFDDAEVDAWMLRYFPDLSPREDGSHLAEIWDIARRQCQAFPWFSDAPEHQLERPPPAPALVQSMALQYQLAGSDYARAYRLAFRAERVESFQGLSVPTVLIDWAGSIMRRHTRALIEAGLPACVRVRTAAAEPTARIQAIVEAFAD
ncbi:MAG: alpha/beta hydrolase [Gammaproteobacteria bacterium]|nr:MAG: alpha/beta hydrolase [Gammaproteobacteria bacterium]